ncbi:MAG: response regulator transcription factor [Anaerolineales bacterium]|nr:response regulator transcription factor [Anaerolineales bacterium]
MADPVRVLLADDHALFRRGLLELLAEADEIEVVGEASDGEQAVELAVDLAPDVILMDVHMPGGGGVEAVRRVKSEGEVRVLMLTVSDKDEDLLGAIDAGADGYLLKNAEPEELAAAIQHIAAGRGALSPEVTGKVMRQASKGSGEGNGADLSPREQEVLEHLAQGDTTAQIAQKLVISTSTVKTHIHHILRKLEAANRAEAVAIAARLGLLPPRD